MDAIVTPVPPIASPCVGICRLDARRTCEGCGRTIGEIARWTAMSPDEREAVMARIAAARP